MNLECYLAISDVKDTDIHIPEPRNPNPSKVNSPVGRSVDARRVFSCADREQIIANSRNSLPSVEGWFHGGGQRGVSLSYGMVEAPGGN